MSAVTLWDALDRIGFDVVRTLLAVLWQSSILLLAVGVLACALRKRRASVRHALWVVALLAAPAVPLLGWAALRLGTPRAEIPVMPAYTSPVTASARPAVFQEEPAVVPAPVSPAPEPAPEEVAFSLAHYPWALALLAYASGLALFLALVAIGRLRIRSWLRSGALVTDARVLEVFERAREELRLSKDFVVVESSAAAAPMTIRTLHPVVLLPAGLARGVSDADLHAVAVHELAHVKRADTAVLSLASLVRAALFFHPLVWIAARQLSLLAEQAADDAVLDVTGQAFPYAQMLARMARRLHRRELATELAVGIVISKSALLQRVEAILSDRRDRIRKLSRAALLATLAGVVVSLLLAAGLPLGERTSADTPVARTIPEAAAPMDNGLLPDADRRSGGEKSSPAIERTHDLAGLPEIIMKDRDDLGTKEAAAEWLVKFLGSSLSALSEWSATPLFKPHVAVQERDRALLVTASRYYQDVLESMMESLRRFGLAKVRLDARMVTVSATDDARIREGASQHGAVFPLDENPSGGFSWRATSSNAKDLWRFVTATEEVKEHHFELLLSNCSASQWFSGADLPLRLPDASNDGSEQVIYCPIGLAFNTQVVLTGDSPLFDVRGLVDLSETTSYSPMRVARASCYFAAVVAENMPSVLRMPIREYRPVAIEKSFHPDGNGKREEVVWEPSDPGFREGHPPPPPTGFVYVFFQAAIDHEAKTNDTPDIAEEPKTQTPTASNSSDTENPVDRDSLTFRPPIERFIHDDGEDQDQAIDFDTGKLFSFPDDFASRDAAAQLEWFRANGADAAGQTGESVRGLACVDMVAVAVAPSWWDAEPHTIPSAIEREETVTRTVMAPGGPEPLPVCRIFKTREGAIGILQILEVVDTPPRGLRVRYKMVQSASKPTGSPEDEARHPNPSDNVVGWFEMTGRDRIIPVFKVDGTYYSVCLGVEVPFKESPEGLEWAFAASNMVGTTIGFDEASNGYYIAVMDSQASKFTEEFPDGGYGNGEKQPLTRIDKPSWLLDPTARPPRTNDDFLGWYQAIWIAGVRWQIRRDGETYLVEEQELHEPGGWKAEEEPRELTILPGGLGFTFHREDGIILTYNQARSRFELTRTTSPTLRVPLARVSPPSSADGRAVPLPANGVQIGIPSRR